MPGRLRERAVRLFVRRVRPWLRSSAAVQRALYDSHNAGEFSSLYEQEKMLADSGRVDVYQAAIARHVNAGDVVLDLGTGTGILAMLAARQGAERVHAIDHSPFIEVARAAARHNGLDTITFAQVNSRSYTPPEKVDVIVHEQMGDSLFDENMVHNLLDLKRRALRPGGRILPAVFELFVEPVALHPDHRVPHLWENRLHGLDFGFARDDGPLLDRYKTAGYGYRWMLMDRSVSHLLAIPEPLVRFDLGEIDSEDAVARTFEEARPVVQAGTLDAFCVYFRAVFDDDISLTTSPLEKPTSWGTRLFRVPQRSYEVGDKIEYRIELTEMTRPGTWSITPTPTAA